MTSRFVLLGMVGLASVACGAAEDGPEFDTSSQGLSFKDSGVSFEDCTEFVGIGFVPTANARPLVPPEYTLAGDDVNAIVVIRTVQCEGIVVGCKSRPGVLSQIGITINDGDPAADINNYTLAYVTDHARLKARLTRAGLKVSMEPHLEFSFTEEGSESGILHIESSPPRAPDYMVDGTAMIPSDSPVPFVASWWADTRRGTVWMRTDIPEIAFGAASTILTTSPGSELAELIGGTSLTFAVLDSYNAFASAEMEIIEAD